MLVIPIHSTTQNIHREAVEGSIALLEYVDSAWRRFERSKGTSMRDLSVPREITRIVIDGEIYALTIDRRIVWFELTGKIKNRNIYSDERFYLSQVTDANGHPFQLHIDRSMCGLYENLHVINAKPLLPMQFRSRVNKLVNGHAHR